MKTIDEVAEELAREIERELKRGALVQSLNLASRIAAAMREREEAAGKQAIIELAQRNADRVAHYESIAQPRAEVEASEISDQEADAALSWLDDPTVTPSVETMKKLLRRALLARAPRGESGYSNNLPCLTWEKPMTSKQASQYLMTNGFVAAELYKAAEAERDKLRESNRELARLLAECGSGVCQTGVMRNGLTKEIAIALLRSEKHSVDTASSPVVDKLGSVEKPEVPRESVHWFAAEMERKLKANDHKGGWSQCGREWLLNRLRDEVTELAHAFDNGPCDDIIGEAADVANFAMMIADNCRIDRPAPKPEARTCETCAYNIGRMEAPRPEYARKACDKCDGSNHWQPTASDGKGE